MNEQTLTNKLKELENDKTFMTMLFAQDTPEKIQEAFASKGIDLTLDQVKSLVVSTVNAAENNGDEIDETALDNVAGGFAITTAVVGWACASLIAAGGIAIGWRLAKGKC